MVVWAKICLLLYLSLWKCPFESHNTNIEAVWRGDETWREGASNTISHSLKDTQYFKDKRTPQKGATNKFLLPPKNHPAPLPHPPTIPLFHLLLSFCYSSRMVHLKTPPPEASAPSGSLSCALHSLSNPQTHIILFSVLLCCDFFMIPSSHASESHTAL